MTTYQENRLQDQFDFGFLVLAAGLVIDFGHWALQLYPQPKPAASNQ